MQRSADERMLCRPGGRYAKLRRPTRWQGALTDRRSDQTPSAAEPVVGRVEQVLREADSPLTLQDLQVGLIAAFPGTVWAVLTPARLLAILERHPALFAVTEE